MPRKGHNQEKIIYALKQSESGVKTAEICRELEAEIRRDGNQRAQAAQNA